MKKLEVMSLLDDFLVNSLMSHKVYGEAASRIILGGILSRRIGKLSVVPQKAYVGEDSECHGVRMDIYLDEQDGEIFDIEPDRNNGRNEIMALPRRVRFYHAKIDSGNLGSGEEYSQLRNVAVIFITDYDPFGKNRMVYTVKNKCVEDPDMPYEDGAISIFLYTKGTEGNPPEELRMLLRYMEDSSTENATTEDLRELHRMVTEVKHDREVGLAYMKSFEREQMIREQSWSDGFEEGRMASLRNLLATGITIDSLLKAGFTMEEIEKAENYKK